MNIDAILERIHWDGALRQDVETLRGLQRAFLASVPFENLDIHRGVSITLEPERIHEKIVSRRRGGFCYECNTVMFDLLTGLGFNVERVSCRMAIGPEPGPEFDHLALVVKLDAEYLVDVGNGQSADQPLALNDSGTVISEHVHYMVAPCESELALWYSEDGRQWLPRFLFTRTPRQLREYTAMCLFHQTSPDSIFTQSKLCTLPTPRGRVTYTGRQLTIRDGHRLVHEQVVNPDEEAALLEKHFGIQLPPERPAPGGARQKQTG